jgi:hypothetical protein
MLIKFGMVNALSPRLLISLWPYAARPVHKVHADDGGFRSTTVV